jgi:hypothetical protein
MSEQEIDKLEAIDISESGLPPVDVEENVDYTIAPDPRDPENSEKYSVVIMTGEFEDWVVSFSDVTIEGKDIEFKYNILYHPELTLEKDEGYYVPIMANFMSALINDIVVNMAESEDGQVYIDVLTGEHI